MMNSDTSKLRSAGATMSRRVISCLTAYLEFAAASFSFCLGVMPPIAILGRSLLRASRASVWRNPAPPDGIEHSIPAIHAVLVVTLDIGILLRLTWLDMGDGDVSLCAHAKSVPLIFRAVIDNNEIRFSSASMTRVQRPDNPFGW